MKRALWPTVWLIIAASLAAGLSVVSGMPYWVSLAIAAFALLVNGLIATVEDNSLSASNNPKDTNAPKHVQLAVWFVRAAGLALALLFVAALAAHYWPG